MGTPYAKINEKISGLVSTASIVMEEVRAKNRNTTNYAGAAALLPDGEIIRPSADRIYSISAESGLVDFMNTSGWGLCASQPLIVDIAMQARKMDIVPAYLALMIGGPEIKRGAVIYPCGACSQLLVELMNTGID